VEEKHKVRNSFVSARLADYQVKKKLK